MLKETISQLKELNELLAEKNNVLEEQIENRQMNEIGIESFKRISS